ncbi:uncharacterized protein LOC129570782 [Sitodiplosis mosellana]|uniref:uncharacterized protein LOC129570782 n=1 Tax=Sitodiplosis mosellana TaxID=263140 RepID=UPI0024437C87|nr:uncharacterized protein LOC129570782 [Sitodiplosis mosellana]
MFRLIVLIIFCLFTFAQFPLSTITNFVPTNSNSYQNCTPAYPGVKCNPFPTVSDLSFSTLELFLNALIGTTNCTNYTDSVILDGTYVNCYIPDQNPKAVNGTTLAKNPSGYIDTSAPCTWLIIPGWMTNCNKSVNSVLNDYSFQTDMAWNLNKLGKCNVFILNYGKFVCDNYVCLLAFLVKRLAYLIAEAIDASNCDVSNFNVWGISLGAEIAGWIARYLKAKNKMLSLVAVADPAGPFMIGQMCGLFKIFEFFESGLGADIAYNTVCLHCNLCCLGTGNTTIAKAHIFLNGGGQQPWILPGNEFGNHASCAAVSAGMTAQSKCLDSITGANFNYFFCSVAPGIYTFNVCQCYPYCMCKPGGCPYIPY